MDHSTLLDRYATLLVTHGLNVQKGQIVCVAAEVVHRDLVQKVVKKAYDKGAKYVHVELQDPVNSKTRILDTQNPEDLTFVPSFVIERYNTLVNQSSCNLRIDGNEDPDLLQDVDVHRINTVQLSFKKKLDYFYQEGIGKAKVQWTVASAATIKWAKKVFPELDEKEAEKALWNAIFSCCRVDREDFLEYWQEHNRLLQTRAKMLTDMTIKKIHFTGPGTDLKVFLSEKARFKGGTDKAASGAEFEPNIPTEECFTTPDCRYTEGHVRVTRPIVVNGVLVDGLEMTFKEGKIVAFDAKKGKETFEAYINSDEGARKLGEVALVDISSPIFQLNRMFHSILYDENAACHIAVGFAYNFCITGGDTMSQEELDAIGCNKSHTHLDMMISSEEVDVVAECYNGKEVPLITKGRWVIGQ